MLARSVLFVSLLVPVASYGAIYQCEVDGQTIFSDQPCGKSSKEIEVNAPGISGGESMMSGGSREFLEHRETKKKLSRIDRQISKLKVTIQGYP